MSTILIAGGSGLIGQQLSQLLANQGHHPVHLSRSSKPDAAFKTYTWDPKNGQMDEKAIQEADYVINLAGAGIADGRWTEERKKLIIQSRVDSNKVLLNHFQKLQKWPKAYLSSAAIGIYGNRGEEWLSETANPGSGFLAESCMAWEKAVGEIAATGIRTLTFRIGIVLSKKGGALAKMLLPLKVGLSTYFGTGNQWYSWIHIDDVCRLFLAGIEREEWNGVYNAVAPNPVRNKAFAKTLAKITPHFSVVLPAPEPALRLAMGEMADVVLTGSRVSAQKIQQAGFEFTHPELQPALEKLLK